MNVSPKLKSNMTFSAKTDIVRAYKEYCKAREINQSLMLEAFMRDFVDGKVEAYYENEIFHIRSKRGD